MRPYLSCGPEGIILEAPRNNRFDLAMRQYIPRRKRLNGCWIFPPEYIRCVWVLLREFYPMGAVDKTGYTEENAPPMPDNWDILWQRQSRSGAWSQPDPKITAYHLLHLLPTAPPQVVDAAYRALSKIHHPDVGGDPTIMQQINDAYEQLKGERHVAERGS